MSMAPLMSLAPKLSARTLKLSIMAIGVKMILLQTSLSETRAMPETCSWLSEESLYFLILLALFYPQTVDTVSH